MIETDPEKRALAAAQRRADRRKRGAKPGKNRAVAILDRRAEGLTSAEAAWRTVRLMGFGSAGKQPLRSTQEVRRALGRGIPVVLRARLPLAPTPNTGELLEAPRVSHTVVLVAYAPSRHAVRVVNSLGVGWGQRGRAWLSIAELEQALAHGRAWRASV